MKAKSINGKSSEEIKTALQLKMFLLVITTFAFANLMNAQDNTSPDQQIKDEVWQLEENYWKYVMANDLKSYLTLWDDNFIGYPSNNIITDKEHITDWITEMYKDKSRKFNYELTRKVENVFGDIVIVLYHVTNIWTNDKNALEKIDFKIIHTWKKTDKGWLIIGGMGAKK